MYSARRINEFGLDWIYIFHDQGRITYKIEFKKLNLKTKKRLIIELCGPSL